MDTEKQICQKIDEIKELLISKNRAYGDTALKPIGVFSKLGREDALKARIDDKLSRIKNKGIGIDTEDTLKDLVGYFILLMIARDERNATFVKNSSELNERLKPLG